MKLVAPIFHTEFDALQVLLKINYEKFRNVAILAILANFFWLFLVKWFKWSLWHQFFSQNLMLYKFVWIGLAKFRQVAILAIFVATFDGVIQMKLVIPIFHTKFDALQLLLRRFFEIPHSGDFWWLLLVELTKYFLAKMPLRMYRIFPCKYVFKIKTRIFL